MERCTVSGYHDLPALPLEELNNLKQTIFQQFSTYWSTPEEYEGLWERAAEAIGQYAKGLRKKRTTGVKLILKLQSTAFSVVKTLVKEIVGLHAVNMKSNDLPGCNLK